MEKIRLLDSSFGLIEKNRKHGEHLGIGGIFHAKLFDKYGNLKWEDVFENLVTTVGKNFVLDTVLAGSSYSATSYMGLISSVSYSAIVAGDTMSSHSGWTEAGPTNAPNYTGDRKTNAWSAAANGSKALNAAHAYVFTGAGTIKGCFVVIGSGASATKDNTGGTLLSAGLFTNGDKVVDTDETLNVSYTLNA